MCDHIDSPCDCKPSPAIGGRTSAGGAAPIDPPDPVPLEGTPGYSRTSYLFATRRAGVAGADPSGHASVERFALYGAVEQMILGLPAAYDRAMDEGIHDGTHWERFAADVGALHALVQAIVGGE